MVLEAWPSHQAPYLPFLHGSGVLGTSPVASSSFSSPRFAFSTWKRVTEEVEPLEGALHSSCDCSVTPGCAPRCSDGAERGDNGWPRCRPHPSLSFRRQGQRQWPGRGAHSVLAPGPEPAGLDWICPKDPFPAPHCPAACPLAGWGTGKGLLEGAGRAQQGSSVPS